MLTDCQEKWDSPSESKYSSLPSHTGSREVTPMGYPWPGQGGIAGWKWTDAHFRSKCLKARSIGCVKTLPERVSCLHSSWLHPHGSNGEEKAVHREHPSLVSSQSDPGPCALAQCLPERQEVERGAFAHSEPHDVQPQGTVVCRVRPGPWPLGSFLYCSVPKRTSSARHSEGSSAVERAHQRS